MTTSKRAPKKALPSDQTDVHIQASDNNTFGTMSKDIIAPEDMHDACQLAECLKHIQDQALLIHEQFEERLMPLLRWFEQILFSTARRVCDDVLCTAIWNCLLFTQARLTEQKTFQNRIIAALPDAEHALIMRQIICNAPRVWSYRRSYQRSFAHTISGPLKTREISLHGSLTAYGVIHRAVHLYAYGWLVTYHGKSWLINAAELTHDQVTRVEQIHPYPLHQDDNLFWEEMFVEILQNLYETRAILDSPPIKKNMIPKQTDYMPELYFARLQKLICRQLNGSETRRTAHDIRQIVAQKGASETLEAARQAVQAFTTTPSPDLIERLLESLGCDKDGNMPKAHPLILANDPTALLLLDPELPIFQHIHERDPIKLALQYEIEHGTDRTIHHAFEQYVAERRWLLSYASFDLSSEDHALVVGFPIADIRAIFDPRLMEARLTLIPRGDYLRQLQEKFGMYLENEEIPAFKDVLQALLSRRIQRGANISPMVQWLFNCCERWRHCISKIDISAQPACRTLDAHSQKLLSNGLSSLAAMFKKTPKA